MNNLLSYCGSVDAKIRASDKDLPLCTYMLIQKLRYPIISLVQLTRYLNDVSKLQDIASCRVHVEWNFLSEKKPDLAKL